MPRTPDGTVAFEYEGSRYEMVFDMKAIAFFERETDTSIVTAMDDMQAAQKQGAAPKVSALAFLMQAGLRRHHPEVTAERALRMATAPEVQEALGVAVGGAMPDPQKAPTERQSRSTGTGSSKGRSKRG